MAEEPIRNLPNSVVESKNSLARQTLIGRLWRGEAQDPKDAALAWLSGELLRWNGDLDRAGFVERVWDSSRWLDLDFPSLVLSEIQAGVWIMQAMRAHRRSLVDQLGKSRVSDPMTPDERARDQMTHVLRVLALFTEGYVSGQGDSIGGLDRTLAVLAESGAGDVRTNAGRLRGHLRTAREDLRQELAGVKGDLQA